MPNLTIFNDVASLIRYVNEIAGVTRLENPTVWNTVFNALKTSPYYSEAFGAYGQYVGILEGDLIVDVGESVVVDAVGGAKSLPAVQTIVTDLSSGGAEVGELAVATKGAGGVLMTEVMPLLGSVVAGLGLGIAQYELSYKFWTDLSNSVFGTSITYEEAEPLLRHKIRTIVSPSQDPNKLITYVPQAIVEKTYNFIKTHINSDVITFDTNFPGAEFDYLGNCIAGKTQPFTVGVLSSELITKFLNNIKSYEQYSGRDLLLIDTATLINKIKLKAGDLLEQCNCFKILLYGFRGDNLASGSYDVVIDGYYSTSIPHEMEVERRKLNTSSSGTDYGFEVTIPTTTTVPKFSHWFSYSNGNLLVDQYKTNSSYGGNNWNFAVGVYWKPNPSNPQQSFYESSSINVHTGKADDYLKNNGVNIVGGRVPDRELDFARMYPEWLAKQKKIAQPDKNKNNKINDYLPVQTPYGHSATDKIKDTGINDDNSDINIPQDDAQKGEIPTDTPIDDLNDAIQDAVDNYNESEVTPESTPSPSPVKPSYPTEPDQPTPDTPDTPSAPSIIGGAASGMISIYNPTKTQLSSFARWLWSPNFLDNFLKIFQNPMDAIIGLHILYATPITDGSGNIVVGYLDSGVSSSLVTNQYTSIDCGTVRVDELYGNVVDYEPYTQVHVYLPFIGIVPLKANDIIGRSVNIKYNVDVLTGTCLAIINTIRDGKTLTMYTFTGNCAVQLPISGGNYSSVVRGLIGMVGGIAVGGVAGAVGGAASILSSKLDVQHSGSIGSNAGAMGARKPYIIITRSVPYDANNYNDFYGYPSNKTTRLSSCKGYTQVKEVHVDELGTATDAEKAEIETLLKTGVIIN